MSKIWNSLLYLTILQIQLTKISGRNLQSSDQYHDKKRLTPYAQPQHSILNQQKPNSRRQWIPQEKCVFGSNVFINQSNKQCDRGYNSILQDGSFRQTLIKSFYKRMNIQLVKNVGVIRRGEPLTVKTKFGSSLFCAIHKSGSTAWKRVLHKAAGRSKSVYLSKGGKVHSEHLTTLGDLKWDEQLELVNSQNVIRWVIVRNPYARLFSAYNEKFVQGHAIVKRKFHQMFDLPYSNKKPATFREFVYKLFSLYNSTTTKQGFQRRFRSLSILNGVDPHFGWQTSFCGMEQGFGFDYVLKSEQIQDWYPKIIKLLNLSDVVMSGWPHQNNCFLSVPKLKCDGPKLQIQHNIQNSNKQNSKLQENNNTQLHLNSSQQIGFYQISREENQHQNLNKFNVSQIQNVKNNIVSQDSHNQCSQQLHTQKFNLLALQTHNSPTKIDIHTINNSKQQHQRNSCQQQQQQHNSREIFQARNLQSYSNEQKVTLNATTSNQIQKIKYLEYRQLHSRGSNQQMLQEYTQEIASMVTEMYLNDIVGLGYPVWDGKSKQEFIIV